MSEEDDAHIANLLRQPAAANLMLLLILGFILLAIVLMARSQAD
jgi:hypothetical protein